ncbi:sensor histidine kinase [Bacillus marinisedimentorum]|uniref:sensor histidine kinase n=1 Tax=Bacillus marinisedimentorum TaxID=1821260 RepID=UPI0008723721|nr:ATP-binding protein [Bacillus marinisedimentorum]
MKRFPLSLHQKLFFTISFIILLTVIFSYSLMNYIYEDLYVQEVETSLLEEGKRLAGEYEGGEIPQELYDRVEWYNSVSESEVFLVDNPRELSACLPFDIDYHSLIGEEERLQLLSGEAVVKDGFEERFDRQITGVIIPLLEDERLQGVIYLYVPIASIEEVFKKPQLFLFIGILVFVLLAIIVGHQIISKLTKPLAEMEKITHHMARGDFSRRVEIDTSDEVGRLGGSFNRMAEALSQVDSSRKEFLANVSHELRTPISYVKGYSEALIDGVVSKKEERKKYLRLINREAGRMQRLVRDLLDLAQMEGQSYPLKKTPLSLAQLINETLEKYEPFLNEKQIPLKTNLDDGVIVMGDEDRLEQVIQNIMDNAIRYTPEGGTIKVDLVEKDGETELSITDSGPGISSEDIARIGERFYRVDKARSRSAGGTGLGMAIVKQILVLHHGKLEIESEEGKGTTMKVVLPVLEDEE